MNAPHTKEIKNLLNKIPDDKYSVLFNFLNWLKDSDEVFTTKESSIIRKSRKEKGGIPWSKLKQNV